ncbi:MAG: preprotein translocase subunit YajC [Marmoricola sp.]
MSASAQLLVIVLAMVAFWAIVMRPARNQQKKVAQLQRDLEIGQRVVLSAGIFGTIRSLTDSQAEVEIAPGTVITVARQVVVRRVDDLEDEGSAAPETREPNGPTGTED